MLKFKHILELWSGKIYEITTGEIYAVAKATPTLQFGNHCV